MKIILSKIGGEEEVLSDRFGDLVIDMMGVDIECAKALSLKYFSGEEIPFEITEDLWEDVQKVIEDYGVYCRFQIGEKILEFNNHLPALTKSDLKITLNTYRYNPDTQMIDDFDALYEAMLEVDKKCAHALAISAFAIDADFETTEKSWEKAKQLIKDHHVYCRFRIGESDTVYEINSKQDKDLT